MTTTRLAAAMAMAMLLAGAGTAVAQNGWPAMEDAKIRPGAVIASATCTANFIFSGPNNDTFYIGTAAHCVDGKNYGDEVCIATCSEQGTLVFSSWTEIDDGAIARCRDKNSNDFALVRVDEASEDEVHPAMLHYGGPTEMGPAQNGADQGQKALTYGNSNLRPFNINNNHEGLVVSSTHCNSAIYTVSPGLPGDSGSPVILGDGQALGVLTTLEGLPPGANGIVNLAPAVKFAEDQTNLDLDLKTWDVVDDGLTP